MGLTWGLTIAGVVLIAYYLKGWTELDPKVNPHAILGIVSTGELSSARRISSLVLIFYVKSEAIYQTALVIIFPVCNLSISSQFQVCVSFNHSWLYVAAPQLTEGVPSSIGFTGLLATAHRSLVLQRSSLALSWSMLLLGPCSFWSSSLLSTASCTLFCR